MPAAQRAVPEVLGDAEIDLAASDQARSQIEPGTAHGLAACFHLLPPLDLLDHVFSSQLPGAWFGLSLYMSFIGAFSVVFVMAIFIAQHYLQFLFLKR
jgi:hypothetical protein